MTQEIEGTVDVTEDSDSGDEQVPAKRRRRSPSQREADRLRILNLRRAGASFRQIRDALGYSSLGHLARDYEAIMRETQHELPEHVRSLELDRLDSMLRVYWPMLTGPDTTVEQKIRAGDAILRIMDRRAKMLGLDAPQKFDITAYLRDFAQREGLPEELVMSEVEGIVAGMGF